MRYVIPLVMLTMLLSSCGIANVQTNGLCEGLQEPVDDLAQTLLDNAQKTPAPVIVTGTRVIQGYDAGCLS